MRHFSSSYPALPPVPAPPACSPFPPPCLLVIFGAAVCATRRHLPVCFFACPLPARYFTLWVGNNKYTAFTSGWSTQNADPFNGLSFGQGRDEQAVPGCGAFLLACRLLLAARLNGSWRYAWHRATVCPQ